MISAPTTYREHDSQGSYGEPGEGFAKFPNGIGQWLKILEEVSHVLEEVGMPVKPRQEAPSAFEARFLLLTDTNPKLREIVVTSAICSFRLVFG